MRNLDPNRPGDIKIVRASIAVSPVPVENVDEIASDQAAIVNMAEPWIDNLVPISVDSGVSLVRGASNPLGEDLLEGLVGVADGVRDLFQRDQPKALGRLLNAVFAEGERCGLRHRSPCFSYGIVQTATYHYQRWLVVLIRGVWMPGRPQLILSSSPDGYRTFEFAVAAAALALTDALSGKAE